ncbi:MAG: hypothetical protein VZR33_08980, partial [Methanosphaera sp.]|nr:hypothetical protein [Methanosphaera sp.]
YNGITKSITITLEAAEEEVNETTEPTQTDSYPDTSSSYNNELDNSYSSADSYSSEEYYAIDEY